MLVDLSLLVTEEMVRSVFDLEKKSAALGHLGTHFDVMDKEFPLSYVIREGVVFDVEEVVRHDADMEIDVKHIDLSIIEQDTFIAFYSGFGKKHPYGTEEYSKKHPQLSDELIDALLDKRISIIGIDFAGIKRDPEHSAKDQYCADRGVFIVENLCNLDRVLKDKDHAFCTFYTFPIKFAGWTGLPCRVVAEVD
ncbi:MAG: hypothetical protein PWP37_1407 [Thermotogota bacterium]|nr:hypothetical protein [Thermotogota bacterium]